MGNISSFFFMGNISSFFFIVFLVFTLGFVVGYEQGKTYGISLQDLKTCKDVPPTSPREYTSPTCSNPFHRLVWDREGMLLCKCGEK